MVELHVTGATEHQLTMPSDDHVARSVCERQEGGTASPHSTLLYGYVREGSSPAVVPNATVAVAWRAPIARGPTVGVRNETLEVESDATVLSFVRRFRATSANAPRNAGTSPRRAEDRGDRIAVTRRDVPFWRAAHSDLDTS